MAEDRRHRLLATALHRVDVAAAERARDDLHQDLGTLGIGGRELSQLERQPGAMEDEGTRGSAHDAAPADTSATSPRGEVDPAQRQARQSEDGDQPRDARVKPEEHLPAAAAHDLPIITAA